jgi:hypothetical protein
MSTTKQLRATLDTPTLTVSALTNNYTALSSAYTPSDGQNYVLAEVEFNKTDTNTPAVSTGLSVWFLRNVDGTNYEDYNDSQDTNAPLARIPDLVLGFRNQGAAQRIIKLAAIPPGTFKVLVKNDGTGVAISGTLRVRPITYQQA